MIEENKQASTVLPKRAKQIPREEIIQSNREKWGEIEKRLRILYDEEHQHCNYVDFTENYTNLISHILVLYFNSLKSEDRTKQAFLGLSQDAIRKQLESVKFCADEFDSSGFIAQLEALTDQLNYD